MDTSLGVNSHDEVIRQIEDIIEKQKAEGSFSVRQVAFNLPSESHSSASTNLAKSLESGVPKEKFKPAIIQKQLKKFRSKRSKSPLPDVVSWPSDSDITVLRMKLLTNTSIKETRNLVLGDGGHQPDSSSMVNLATLLAKSQTSKHSQEEYLFPLTSWEQKSQDVENNLVEGAEGEAPELMHTSRMYSLSPKQDTLTWKDSDYSIRTSKMAKFLRLYFCPCWTCLYRLENMQEEPSPCFTKTK